MKAENNQQMLGQWTKLIRMQHPEKMLKFVRGFQDETLATLYGIPDTETFLRLKNSLQRQTKEAAAQLLEDPAFADRVDQLPFRQGGIHCRNEDIAAVGDVMRNLSDPVVDTQADFGLPANAVWMEEDGLHPSLAGHQVIVTLLVQELTGGK